MDKTFLPINTNTTVDFTERMIHLEQWFRTRGANIPEGVRHHSTGCEKHSSKWRKTDLFIALLHFFAFFCNWL